MCRQEKEETRNMARSSEKHDRASLLAPREGIPGGEEGEMVDTPVLLRLSALARSLPISVRRVLWHVLSLLGNR